MTTASARKGASFERLVITFLRSRLGQHLTLPRAGAKDDRGDIAGIPDFTLQLKAYKDLATGLRNGIADLKVEQANTGTRWGAVILKRPRSQKPEEQLVVMELGQWADLIATKMPEIGTGLRRVDL